MQEDISEDTVRALFAQTIEPTAILITITSADLDDPIRVTDYAGRLSKNVLGIASRGAQFLHFPFSFAWSGAGNGELGRNAQLIIGNTAGEITDAIEAITDVPALTVELVRVSAPDVVERAMTGAELKSTDEDGPKITGTILPRRFDTEPACGKSYLPATTPAKF